MTDELTKIIETISEAFVNIGEAIKKLLKPFSDFFKRMNQISVKHSIAEINNKSNRYFQAPNNRYSRIEMKVPRKIEHVIQKHLPYQRRIY